MHSDSFFVIQILGTINQGELDFILFSKMRLNKNENRFVRLKNPILQKKFQVQKVFNRKCFTEERISDKPGPDLNKHKIQGSQSMANFL